MTEQSGTRIAFGTLSVPRPYSVHGQTPDGLFNAL